MVQCTDFICAAQSIFRGERICVLCGGFIDGFGLLASDAWSTFFITPVLVALVGTGVLHDFCSLGRD